MTIITKEKNWNFQKRFKRIGRQFCWLMRLSFGNSRTSVEKNCLIDFANAFIESIIRYWKLCVENWNSHIYRIVWHSIRSQDHWNEKKTIAFDMWQWNCQQRVLANTWLFMRSCLVVSWCVGCVWLDRIFAIYLCINWCRRSNKVTTLEPIMLNGNGHKIVLIYVTMKNNGSDVSKLIQLVVWYYLKNILFHILS